MYVLLVSDGFLCRFVEMGLECFSSLLSCQSQILLGIVNELCCGHVGIEILGVFFFWQFE